MWGFFQTNSSSCKTRGRDGGSATRQSRDRATNVIYSRICGSKGRVAAVPLVFLSCCLGIFPGAGKGGEDTGEIPGFFGNKQVLSAQAGLSDSP